MEHPHRDRWLECREESPFTSTHFPVSGGGENLISSLAGSPAPIATLEAHAIVRVPRALSARRFPSPAGCGLLARLLPVGVALPQFE
jgi:hypothetical protein